MEIPYLSSRAEKYFSTREDKFGIPAWPCNILYTSLKRYCKSTRCGLFEAEHPKRYQNHFFEPEKVRRKCTSVLFIRSPVPPPPPPQHPRHVAILKIITDWWNRALTGNPKLFLAHNCVAGNFF